MNRRVRLTVRLGGMDVYKSSGARPVCLAIRANIFGPISSVS